MVRLLKRRLKILFHLIAFRRRVSLFNEVDYLEYNPDVAASLKRGEFESGYDHFIRHGVREGRFPGFRGFNAKRYSEKNSLRDMSFGDLDKFAKDHFRVIGFSNNYPH